MALSTPIAVPKGQRTKTLMLLVTYQCNLRCSYCYEPKTTHSHISEAMAKEVLSRQISLVEDEYEAFEVQFMGGEPLLQFPLIKNLSEWLWSQSFPKALKMVFAATNGTLLTDEMKGWLTQNRERFCLGLSFDGDEQMQNRNRSGSAPAIDLAFFAKTWPQQSVKMTVSPDTVSHLRDGVLWLNRAGFANVVADMAMGDNIRWERKHLEELRKQLEKLTAYYLSHRDVQRMSMLDWDLAQVLRGGDNRKNCSCGEAMVCIDVTGREYGCHLFSPVALPADRALKSREIDFADHQAFVTEECVRCAIIGLCGRCHGMNYICNGNVAEPIGYHCSVAKLLFAANCKLWIKEAIADNDEARLKLVEKIINHIKTPI